MNCDYKFVSIDCDGDKAWFRVIPSPPPTSKNISQWINVVLHPLLSFLGYCTKWIKTSNAAKIQKCFTVKSKTRVITIQVFNDFSFFFFFWCLGEALSHKIFFFFLRENKKYFQWIYNSLQMFKTSVWLKFYEMGSLTSEKVQQKYILNILWTETHNCLMKRLSTVLSPSLAEFFYYF